MRFDIDGVVFRWESRRDSEWVFVPLPAAASADIREIPLPPRGFGSVRVRARIGTSDWTTSIFPDSTAGAYVLPLKRSVRIAEGIEIGDTVRGTVELVGV